MKDYIKRIRTWVISTTAPEDTSVGWIDSGEESSSENNGWVFRLYQDGEWNAIQTADPHANVYRYKGSVVDYSDLPANLTESETGYVYNVENDYGQYPGGTNFAWTGTEWDALGGSWTVPVYKADWWVDTNENIYSHSQTDVYFVYCLDDETGRQFSLVYSTPALAYFYCIDPDAKLLYSVKVQNDTWTEENSIDLTCEWSDGVGTNSLQRKDSKAIAYGDYSIALGAGSSTKQSFRITGAQNATTYTTNAAHGLSVNDVVAYGLSSSTTSLWKFAVITAVDSTTSFTVNQTLNPSSDFSGQIIYIIKGYSIGNYSSSNGTSNAFGDYSSSEGNGTLAFGYSSHAEGFQTTSSNYCTHAEGYKTSATGNQSHAEGHGTTASGYGAHAEGGWYDDDNSVEYAGGNASGNASHVEGARSIASGDYSHAEGFTTEASKFGAHAEGENTVASGTTSHAEGYGTVAGPEGSAHAEGSRTTASGAASHAEGYQTTASGSYSHAEGVNTIARNGKSHAEGDTTKAYGDNSHAEGYNTTASNGQSHAEGHSTVASGTNAHAEGYNTRSESTNSHAEGNGTTASGSNSHAEGDTNIASGNNTHVEGYNNNVSGNNSHAEGGNATVTGHYSHAEGRGTTVSGDYSHAEGDGTTVSGNNAHAEGYNNTASGNSSHVEGYDSTASEPGAHAEGRGTTASAKGAHSEGLGTTASGKGAHAEGGAQIDDTYYAGGNASGQGSHAEGIETIAQNQAEHAEGQYNESHTVANSSFGNAGNTIHSIGIGTSSSTKRNAIEVMQNGDVYIYRAGTYDGTNPTSGTNDLNTVINKKQPKWTSVELSTITYTVSDNGCYFFCGKNLAAGNYDITLDITVGFLDGDTVMIFFTEATQGTVYVSFDNGTQGGLFNIWDISNNTFDERVEVSSNSLYIFRYCEAIDCWIATKG